MKNSHLGAAAVLVAGFLHGCLNAPIVSPTPISSTRKSAKNVVSRANFIALKWQHSGGYTGIQTQMLVHNGSVTLHNGAPDNKKPSQNKTLTQAEFQRVLKALNDAKFIQIVGRYSTPGMSDGFSDVVTLVLQTPGEKPRSFVVDSYGDAAPKAFYALITSLKTLKNQKFADGRN